MSKALKTLSITLILLLSTLVAFSIERDSLLAAVKKGSNRVIAFDQKITVTLKNGQTYKGEYKILNDSTIIINDTEIRFSQIKSIERVNSKDGVIIGASAFHLMTKSFAFTDILGPIVPVSLLISFIFMFLLIAAPKKLSTSKYQLKVLPLKEAYKSNIALLSLGLMLLGIVFSNLGFGLMINIYDAEDSKLAFVPTALLYGLGIIAFFKGYTDSLQALKLSQKNKTLLWFNVILGSVYIIGSVLMNIFFIYLKLDPPDIYINI